MLAEAKTEKLIYVSDMTNNEVYALSYRTGKMVGSVSGPSETAGLCSDAHGNVYVTGNNEVDEFAHGGTKPIARFKYSSTEFSNCSVDPVTGKLAATMFEQHNVAVFSNAGGNATLVPINKGTGGACAYDPKGNLYVDEGDEYIGISLEKLSVRGSSFVTLATGISSEFGPLQWHDETLLMNVPEIQQFRVSRGQATQIGEATLAGANSFRDVGENQFVVQDGLVIVPFDFEQFGISPPLLGFWKYPEGTYVKAYGGLPNDLLDGVAISATSSV
ncbi:MAG TPA: hypothetical protein VGK84_09550 [Candidatus Tumulicola sp.]|jgi:hypothetical protein